VHAVTDTESARAFLQRYADRQAADEGRIYGIRLDGELVGGMLFRLFSPSEGSCELGAWLAPGAQGRGLVTTAARRMIDWAVGVRGLERVEWLVSPGNGPSIAVAERLGMTYEGTLRSVFSMGGRRHDLQVWALLADEWRAGAGRDARGGPERPAGAARVPLPSGSSSAPAAAGGRPGPGRRWGGG
jgi:RimJ/RimL family protein N-acetyltransferase